MVIRVDILGKERIIISTEKMGIWGLEHYSFSVVFCLIYRLGEGRRRVLTMCEGISSAADHVRRNKQRCSCMVDTRSERKFEGETARDWIIM